MDASNLVIIVLIVCSVLAVIMGIVEMSSEAESTDSMVKPKDLGNDVWSFPTDDDRTFAKMKGAFEKSHPKLEIVGFTAKGGPMASGYLVLVKKKAKK